MYHGDVLKVCASGKYRETEETTLGETVCPIMANWKLPGKVFKKFEFYAILSSLITFFSYCGGLLLLIVIKACFSSFYGIFWFGYGLVYPPSAMARGVFGTSSGFRVE